MTQWHLIKNFIKLYRPIIGILISILIFTGIILSSSGLVTLKLSNLTKEGGY